MVRALGDAALYKDAETAEAALATAAKDGMQVGAYLADAIEGATGPEQPTFVKTFAAQGHPTTPTANR